MIGAVNRDQALREDHAHRVETAHDQKSIAATIVVAIAMLIIALATAVAVHLHMGIQPHFAVLTGFGVFSLLLSTHLLASRPAKPSPQKQKPRFTADEIGQSTLELQTSQQSAHPQSAEAPAAMQRHTHQLRDNPQEDKPHREPAAPQHTPAELPAKLAAALEATITQSNAEAAPNGLRSQQPPQQPATTQSRPAPSQPERTRVLQGLSKSPAGIRPEAAAEVNAPEAPRLSGLQTARITDAARPDAAGNDAAHTDDLTLRATSSLPPQSLPTHSLGASRREPKLSMRTAPETPNASPDGPALPMPPQSIEHILKRMAAQIQSGRTSQGDMPDLAPELAKNTGTSQPASRQPEARPAPASRPAAPAAETPADAIAVGEEPAGPADPATPNESADTAAATNPRLAINVAVDALRAAADEMRNQVKDPAQPKTPTIHARLAEVAEAVSRDQLDIYLNPIFGLDNGAPRHFELTVQARTIDGDCFDPEDFREVTRGSGLMPLLDTSRLRHSAAIAGRLTERITDASVFSTLEGETLDNRRFFSSIEQDRTSGRLPAALLVLSLRQGDVRNFVPAHYQSLRLLRDMGFRFALQDITDLDMNFEDLATIGFEFAKLDAEVYLDGMHVDKEKLPAAEVCRHLESVGLSIIVDDITSEQQRTDVETSGATFGQGSVFGPPSPIRRAPIGATEAA